MNNENPEIAKLSERMAKDPKSKLFVPLAEEYKKAGDFEMAIHVLLEGLQHNPGYVTARSFLGKLLLAKGDLAGAQKEFEEVIKTTPDNFTARRNLGDLHVLQNRPHDALPHYKIALSLNPRDEELTLLITDAEAGRDVKSRVQHSTGQPSDPEPAVKEVPAAVKAANATVAAAKTLSDSSGEQPNEPTLPSGVPAVAQSSRAETASAPVPMEIEEPEEVLIVEPLESEPVPPQPITSDAADSAISEQTEPVSPEAEEESFNFDFSPQNHEDAGTGIKEDVPVDQDLFSSMDGENKPPSIFEETAGEQLLEPGALDVVTESALEIAPEEGLEKSDDFTTDTLAELYIAQGFYEKAIEIYERMLSDKPNSRGLQDKLAAVRAHAAQAVVPAADVSKEADIPAAMPEAREYIPEVVADAAAVEPSVFDEPNEYLPKQDEHTEDFNPVAFAEAKEYVPQVAPEEITLEAELLPDLDELTPGEPSPDEKIFEELGEYKPVAEQEEHEVAAGDALLESAVDATAREGGRTKPQVADFKPREYLPPDASKESLVPAGAHVKETVHETPVAGRKETIARLETWLSNIKKEK